jgi:hypothetical protein
MHWIDPIVHHDVDARTKELDGEQAFGEVSGGHRCFSKPSGNLDRVLEFTL